MKKPIILIATCIGFSAPALAGDPITLSNQQLDGVVAGCGTDCGGETPPPPPPRVKGNNGWGNGIDPTNPGSPKGNNVQAQSKLNNSYTGIAAKLAERFGGR